MFKETSFKEIYIACGYTNLRLGIDGLAALVMNQFDKEPFREDTIFLFCGRKSDRIKALVWESDGFLLLYKRLENGRFHWPRNTSELKNLTDGQLQLLLSGFEIESSIKPGRPPEFIL